MKKERSSLLIHGLLQAAQTLAVVCMILIVTGCGGTPAAQVSGSGWKAHRYGSFDTVKASTVSSLPNQLQILGNGLVDVNNNGYITTDSTGQGEIKKDTCDAYIFQSGSGSVKQEYLSACSKGSVCTISLINCSGITVVTLPANITFGGTYVTIIIDNSMETVTVMSLEGVATVTPTDQSFPTFEVGPGQGAYAVTASYRDQASGFFGFGPGELRDLGQFTVPIENLRQIQQIQSANLIAISQGLPIIPIPAPYSLDFRWLYEKNDNKRALEAIVRGVNLYPMLDQQFSGIPFFISAEGERIDLRSLGYDPGLSNQLLKEAGYSTGQGMILAYDQNIPGIPDLAAFIADEMKKTGAIIFTPQGVNLFNENPFAGLEESGLPVLFIGGS